MNIPFLTGGTQPAKQEENYDPVTLEIRKLAQITGLRICIESGDDIRPVCVSNRERTVYGFGRTIGAAVADLRGKAARSVGGAGR